VDESDKLEKIYAMVETFNISDYSTMLITNEFYNISNVTSHMDQTININIWITSIHAVDFIHTLTFIHVFIFFNFNFLPC